MGTVSSKGIFFSQQHPSNDYELAIKASKELEYILENEFNSVGRGLHEKISYVSSDLPTHLIKQMRYLATIRNKLIHERGFDTIPNRINFIETFEKSATELQEIIKKRNGRYHTNDQGCIIC